MIKHKCHLEVVKNDQLFSFNCDHRAPLSDVIASLQEMKDHAEQVLQEAIKQQEELKQKEESNGDKQ